MRSTSRSPVLLSTSYFTFEPVGISMTAGTGSSMDRGSSTSCDGWTATSPPPPRATARARLDAGSMRVALIAHLGLGDAGAGRDARGEPDVPADGRALPDRDAAEDGGARVHHDVVLDDRVPRDPLHRVALRVEREALRAERHALVEPDVPADHRGLPDDDAGAMVDEELVPDGGPGVDVDPGERVRVLGDDPGDERDAEDVQLVGDPLVRDGEDPRVREDRLVAALQRRVALVRGLDVGADEGADRRDLREEPLRHLLRHLRAVIAGLVVVARAERDAAPDLILEVAHGARERRADEVVQALVVEVARPEVAGEFRELLRVGAELVHDGGEGDEVDRGGLRAGHFASSKSQVDR